jgi:hypothetical protein
MLVSRLLRRAVNDGTAGTMAVGDPHVLGSPAARGDTLCTVFRHGAVRLGDMM